MSSAILRHQLAAELARAAEATGDSRFRLAAGMLLGRAPGRRRKDDALAVAEMHALVEAGHCATPTEAARRIAPSLGERIADENIVSRLMSKYRRAYGKK